MNWRSQELGDVFCIFGRGAIGFVNVLCLLVKVKIKHSESFGVCGIVEWNRIRGYFICWEVVWIFLYDGQGVLAANNPPLLGVYMEFYFYNAGRVFWWKTFFFF